MHYKKKDLLRMVGTLEAINRLVKTADSRKLAQMQENDTFADCQRTAIEIGTWLEMCGEYTEPTVKLLEDYCENIYQISMGLSDLAQCRKLSKKIQKQLSEIATFIRYGLPEDKKEIVFLPYKASMWDSLESIWMAAQEDENCEAYVVPIPYFDKNPDGSLREMHYEGNQYPDDVPITDWREYNIEEHRPDIIYIHNPYDKCNYVTTVHPDYYASNLKKYTKMLVYCPYFVGINSHVEEHFCTTPGVLYADRVIVESESVKEIYVNALREFERENGCPGMLGDLDKKILALGSPKLDRIGSTAKENMVLPQEWKRIIIKEDTTRKKVVLYNTTVDALLKNSEAVIGKIKDVLRTFKENRDVALLWRPHPLVEATLYSMRPDLYREYIGIVQAYRNEAWGIYDDTADLERAIVISDAYFGDWSSVVTLYQATGKPVMIQNYGAFLG